MRRLLVLTCALSALHASAALGAVGARREYDVLRALPANAQWLFAMHSDSAPLRLDWFEWLRERIGEGFAAAEALFKHILSSLK